MVTIMDSGLPKESVPYKGYTGFRYKQAAHVGGWTMKSLGRLGITLGAFGGVAGFTAIFFAEGVPRMRRDVLQKIPILGSYWIREIPPSDNVSASTLPLSKMLSTDVGQPF